MCIWRKEVLLNYIICYQLTKHVPCNEGAAAHIMPRPTWSSMTRAHWKLDKISTVSFWSTGLGSPAGNDVIPHPMTVPFWPTYELPVKKNVMDINIFLQTNLTNWKYRMSASWLGCRFKIFPYRKVFSQHYNLIETLKFSWNF